MLKEAAEAVKRVADGIETVNEQKITAGLLQRLMSDISEDSWCASWAFDLEYVLWDAVTGKRKKICTPETIAQLKYLSDKCGGWIIWDKKKADKKFVPMAQWLRIYRAKPRYLA